MVFIIFHPFAKIMTSVDRMLTTVTRPMASAPTFKAPSPVPVPVGFSYRVMDKHAVVKSYYIYTYIPVYIYAPMIH